MSDKSELGRRGEIIATNYLLKNGFEILHNNWTYKNLELDIVAKKGEYLVFVEVKSRSETFILDPIDAITPKKQKFLFNAAESYAEIYEREEKIRFDIVLVVFNEQSHKLEYIEDAFRPGW